MDGGKPAKGESATKRQTRSIHEKQRRIEMNTVLSEMFDLLSSSDDEKPSLPKKPDKCWIIGKGVDMIREARIVHPHPEHFADFFMHSTSEVAIFEIRDFLVVKMMGDTRAIFGVEKARMIGKDFRSFLDFDSGVNFKIGAQKVWSSIIGRRFSANWQNNLLICFAEPSKLTEERPILAAMLSATTTTTIPTTNPSTHHHPPNNNDTTPNTTITPSLHCDDSSSSSSAFLSPQSSSSSAESKSRVVAAKSRSRATRKRLRSVNVIVETYALKSSATATTAATTSQLQIPALISPTPTPLNPYDVLAPGYRDIWLRLQSERLLLEQRVMAKERELQNLMMATYSNPP